MSEVLAGEAIRLDANTRALIADTMDPWRHVVNLWVAPFSAKRGVRLPDEPPLQPKPRLKLSTIQGFKRPDGRPWINMERWNEMQRRMMAR